MKKILLGLGTLATVAAPIAATVSCGDDNKKDSSLEETRISCINQINSETDLSQEQKDGFVQRLNEAKTKDEMLEIAKEADEASLKAYKEVQIAYVNSLDNEEQGLTDEDKATTINKINGAETKTEIDEIVDGLPQLALEKYKTSEGLLIEQSEKLDEAGKSSWSNKLNAANDLDSAREVISQMNIEIFEKSKKDAEDRLNSYSSLTKEQKELCLSEVKNAKNDEELDAAIKHMDTLAFDEVKTNAKAETDGYVGWDDTEKAALESAIDSAKDVDELNATVKDAKLKHEKADATSKINSMNLTGSEKNSFIEEVKNAGTINEIKDIVKSALLQEAKNNASTTIDGYTLSDVDREAFKNNITQAVHFNGVQSVLASALEHQTKEVALRQARSKAISEIENLELLDSEKAAFKDKINKSLDQANVQSIVDLALLQQAKEKNIEIINNLKNQSQADLNGYKAKVNSATTVDSVNFIGQEAKIIDQYSGKNNFDVTLNDAGSTTVSGVSLDLKHTNGLSDGEKLETVKELLTKPSVKITNEYDPKYGQAPWLMVHNKVIPGIHHKLHELTDDEKLIYVNNVFTRMFINKDDTTPDLMPVTFWGYKFSDDLANICPALNKGGWYTTSKGNINECLSPNEDNLITEAEYKLLDTSKLASQGIAIENLPDQFKIHFFNNMFFPTFTGYHHAMTTGSLSKVITDESKFIDGTDHSAGAFQNDLVINGNHFKVSHTSDKLNSAEGVEIYYTLVKSILSLDLMKLDEAKKVSSYNLSDSGKLELLSKISTATTIKQINDYVNAAK